MTNLVEYGFARSPFPITPDYKVTNWAGMDEVRRILRDIIESPLSTDTGLSEFVIILGSYGAGKTHALRYLTTLINDVEADYFKSKAIYVPKVQVASKISFLSLYFQVIEDLGIDFLKELSGTLRQKVKVAADAIGEQLPREEERELRDEDADVFIKRAIESIPNEDRAMIQLLLELAEGKDAVATFITIGKPVIEGSSFTQQINSDYMAARMLASLIRAMTISIGDQEPAFRAVHLFLDEVEDVLESKVPEQMSFFSSIRELVNRLPYNFALLLSFSAEAALLEAMMPQFMDDRKSRQNVELQDLEFQQAKDFIRNQLENFRPEGFVPPQAYFPFTEDAINYILEQTVLLVPRKIFRSLRIVLERAIKREGLNSGDEISAEMAEEIMVSMGI